MSSATAGAPSEEHALVSRLTLEQKVRLLTGADAWLLHGEEAVGLRPLLLSDGPAGVRGKRFDAANPSTSLPAPIGLAATWDVALVEELARALGREAQLKGVDVLLGPTVNIIRTPLSGRGFECFAEDPLLTSRIAVAYVRGVQSAGVGATVKHFVANDSETERRSYDARVTEQVLREVYLPPFEACVAEADVALVMAAYNSVNGDFMTANPALLRGLLKTEWGFPGVVVSDWSATGTTVASARAGLDLVMPGPRGPWGEELVAAVRAGKVPEAEIDDKVARLLVLGRRVGAVSAHANGDSPGLVGAAGEMIDAQFVKQVTARSFVMLRNRGRALPLKPGSVTRVALIGPNAVEPQLQGGGSVRVQPVVRPGLADSLRDALDAYVSVDQGCQTSATVALPADGTMSDPVTGRPGVRLQVRAADGSVALDAPFPTSAATWWDGLPDAVHQPGAEVVMTTRYRAAADGRHVLGAAGVGLLRVFIDGAEVAEATTPPPRDAVEALSRPPELRVPLDLRAGREVEVRVEHRPNARGLGGFANLRLGIVPRHDDDSLIAAAMVAAAAADVAVVVVGSADGTESEGYDRDTMALPGRQDELVTKVAAANPNTVVIVNSGTPVLMPWADEVAAIVQVWFPGQAYGEALADVLVGALEPGGRLPVSIPRAEADSPVLRAQPEAGELVYREGHLVGYRGYDRSVAAPLFGFGHGLGYTDWSYASIAAEGPIGAGDDLPVTVTIRNAGARAGREVVQVYLEPPDDDPTRPLRILAAFASVSAAAGELVEARLVVPARAFARFDEASHEWSWTPGAYRLRAGRSSRDLRLDAEVVLR